ncbi:MAG: sugar phosphate isomerase/epimerase [Deltaproteobacteria bacterium]|nr:sugar phosphate isomerase/epimerase [Deltaproteobacteria bacterium]MBW2306949.1 sugar phosphate isomerase/epimerase [Deltaproteobacteria bacterium]
MKPCGHTMGTPEFSPKEAVDFFADMGYEAIEFLCTDDYRCAVSPNAPPAAQAELAKQIRDRGLEPACLTPYITDLNHPDEEEYRKQKDLLKNAVEIAARIGFKYVRVYGGRLVEAEKRRSSLECMVAALRECASVAENNNVVLAVENHYNTLTVTASETMEVIRAANHPAVKVLYDQSNITQMGGEDYTEAIALQKEHIAHVHVKDIVFKTGAIQQQVGDVTHIDPSKRAVRSRVIGKGILPWPEIIDRLHGTGYRGYLSVEYGRKWYPEDLPPPEQGLRQSLEFLQHCLSKLK